MARFHRHRYEWKPELRVFGFEHYQQKVCAVCGKVKQRKVGWATDLCQRGGTDDTD